MIIDFQNKPLQIHRPFHLSRAKERMNFGAFGSGKTYAVVDEAIAWCLEQPGIRGALARKTIPELRDSTEPILMERIPYDLLKHCTIGRSGGHIERVVFPNGSTILCRSVDDWNKWRSLNLGFIAIDESNELDEESYMGIRSRVRQRDITAEARKAGYTHEITRRGVFGATNPAGHDWLYRRFHPDSPDRQPDCQAFLSTTLDNPFLTPDYVESLLQMPKPWIKRFVLCQFDDFAGRIYEDWGWDTHVIDHPDWKTWEPTELRGRLFWMGMDPGTENPTAGLWVWLDKEQRRLVGVAEYEEGGLAADVHAAAWKRIEANQQMAVRWRVADPNAIGIRDRGTMISLQTQYAKLGFNFSLGASSEGARIPALGRLIALRRFVVTKNCPRTFEAIKQYQWRDLTPAERAKGEDPKEKPLKKNTHLVECAQYLAGREAPLPPIQKPTTLDPLNEDIWNAIRRQQGRAARRKYGGEHDFGTIPV